MMTIHNWERVLPRTFHDQHQVWAVEIRSALNSGILPDDFYSQVASNELDEPDNEPMSLSSEFEPDNYLRKQSRVVVRHNSDDRLVAIVEISSSFNKSSDRRLKDFVNKAIIALDEGCHLLIVDLYPPTKRDPNGIHGVIWEQLGGEPYVAAPEKPLTLASYVGGIPCRAYVEPVAVGDVMIPMPLFLSPTNYISVPLEETYQKAYRGVPKRWKQILEGA